MKSTVERKHTQRLEFEPKPPYRVTALLLSAWQRVSTLITTLKLEKTLKTSRQQGLHGLHLPSQDKRESDA
jgi:hypothetical protein